MQRTSGPSGSSRWSGCDASRSQVLCRTTLHHPQTPHPIPPLPIQCQPNWLPAEPHPTHLPPQAPSQSLPTQPHPTHLPTQTPTYTPASTNSTTSLTHTSLVNPFTHSHPTTHRLIQPLTNLHFPLNPIHHRPIPTHQPQPPSPTPRPLTDSKTGVWTVLCRSKFVKMAADALYILWTPISPDLWVKCTHYKKIDALKGLQVLFYPGNISSSRNLKSRLNHVSKDLSILVLKKM